MLQDTVLSAEQFCRLLLIQPATLRTRVHNGDAAFAFGLKRNPHHSEYRPLDALSIMMSSVLADAIGMKPAAEIVRETCMDTKGARGWLSAVQLAEDDPRLYDKRQPEIPVEHQLYLAVGVTKNKPAFAIVGPTSVTMPKLIGYTAHAGLSIHNALRQLRNNARDSGVALPPRLTVSINDPEEARWRQEIEDYRRLGTMRFRDKLKARRRAEGALA